MSKDQGRRVSPPFPQGAPANKRRPANTAPGRAVGRPNPSVGTSAGAAFFEVIVGKNAVAAACLQRPGDIRRVVVSNLDALPEDIRRALDSLRMRPEKGSDGDLRRLAGSDHHEGFLACTAPRRWLKPGEFAKRLVQERGVAVAFDRVRNPYNIGAILRTAAFLGARGALFGPIADLGAELLPSLAVRVAEGGAEYLALSRTTDLASTLSQMREAGIQVLGAAGEATTPYTTLSIRRPTILVVGNEAEGMSERVRNACDTIAAIPGTGNVESLNVGVASALLIQHALRG